MPWGKETYRYYQDLITNSKSPVKSVLKTLAPVIGNNKRKRTEKITILFTKIKKLIKTKTLQIHLTNIFVQLETLWLERLEIPCTLTIFSNY